MQPRDLFSRPLRDLRISVTDRCNFRCTYCMPREVFGTEYPFLPKADVLTFEEIVRLARVFVGLGVRKLRLTGGEPLLRRDLDVLVRMLAAVPGVEDLALTTNGSLLAEQAARLRRAGLQRLTVSLDSLRPEVFARMGDTSVPLQRVLAGIEAAQAAGFVPIKLNMVVKRRVNEEDIGPMRERFGGPGYVLRFIEYMDVGNSNRWRQDEVVPAAEIVTRLEESGGLTSLPANYCGEVAKRFRTEEGGEIGIISSVSQPFCGDCHRARLSAEGRLYTCLFTGVGHDLRTYVRSAATEEELGERIAAVWRRRDDRYSEIRAAVPSGTRKAEMSLLGG